MYQYFGKTATKINKKVDAIGYKKPFRENANLISLLVFVAVTAFCVARSFAGSIEMHCFSAGGIFDESKSVDVSTKYSQTYIFRRYKGDEIHVRKNDDSYEITFTSETIRGKQ